MAFHTGKPAYRSNPSSAEVRESLAYLKTYTDLISGAGVSQDDLTYGFVPVGSVLAYVPGYFTSGANAGFTVQLVSANTAAGVNALLNSKGFYVCNGAALNDALGDIFNGSGRYLPNLTDDRFLMGDTVAGGTGGANSSDISHVHTTGDHALTESELASHDHTVSINAGGSHYHTYNGATGGAGAISHNDSSGNYRHVSSSGNTSTGGSHAHSASIGDAGSGAAHNHGDTGSAGSSTFENRPTFLSCFYIMRVH